MFPPIPNVTWKFTIKELSNVFTGEIESLEVITLRENGNDLCGRYELVGNSDGWGLRYYMGPDFDNEVRFGKETYMTREEGIKALQSVCGL